MNSTKLQDTRLIYRNLLQFYTLILNYQNDKVKKKKKNSFKIISKRIKYLAINLRQNTYAVKSIKHSQRKLKMIQKWKDILCSQYYC